MLAEWLTGVGTLALAVVAVFQDAIRGQVYRPKFRTSIKTKPPDCIAIPVSLQNGTFADSIYIRLWVQNTGNAPAKNVEVYAKELRYRRADQSWEQVDAFPPMNLGWSNYGGNIYFPVIVPGMGKHCDVFHIIDPARRDDSCKNEQNPRLNLTNEQTSMTFDLMASPNHKGHIVRPGEYRLKILVAAENARPFERTISISLRGTWYADEARMLRDGVGVSVS